MNIYLIARRQFDAARFGVPFVQKERECWHGHRFMYQIVTSEEADITTSFSRCDEIERLCELPEANSDSELLNRIGQGLQRVIWSELSSARGLRRVRVLGDELMGYFSEIHAAHFLPNVWEGHQCARLHGHNFGIEVVQRDKSSLAHLEASEFIKSLLHKKLLNDIKGLVNPTSENLACYLLEIMESRWPTLLAVKVMETRQAGCIAYLGYKQLQVYRDFSFESATVDNGDLVLGHSYRMRVHLRLPLHDPLGWTMDYAEIKRMVQPLIDSLDHRDLQLVSLPDQELMDLSSVSALAAQSYLWLRERMGDGLCMVEVFASDEEGALVMASDQELGSGLWLC